MFDEAKRKEVFEFLDEARQKTNDRNLLIDWVMIKFNFTPEQASFGFTEWLDKTYEKKRLDIEIDYVAKIKDIEKYHLERIRKLDAWRGNLIPSPSHIN